MKLKTKAIIVASAIGVIATSAFSATILKYFSPNNDGTRDVLEFPFSVKDNGRIISWKMVIENSRGKVVRTIGNKISLPTKISASGILKQIVQPKESVIIPDSVTWDGTMDDGTMAPDGEYFYYISVIDENKNESKTKKYNVFLDNTPPTATLVVPKDENLVFGEGEKAEFLFKQTGSVEKLWTAKIFDLAGNTVRTLTYENAKPTDFSWDGTDDNGKIIPDGVYNYVLVGEDKAGNISEEYTIKNIIFSAEKPSTNISINGSKYFSVAEKSSISSITFDVEIPEPKNVNKLIDWSVEIFSKSGDQIRTYNKELLGTKNVSKIVFDGFDDNKNKIAEGEYFAQVQAKYLNGFETVPVKSSTFVFDKTSPTASVVASEKIFSPDGDGRKDFIKFKIETSKNGGAPIKSWSGKIVNSENENESILEFNYGEFFPAELTWNGLDKNGKLASDGNYDFILTGIDMAGNSVTVKTSEYFALDTSKTEIMLAADNLIFSPNTDSVQDSITFTPVIKNSSNIAKFSFDIKSASGKSVYNVNGESKVPLNFVWNGKDSSGKIAQDGKYSATLLIESTNGSISKVEIPEIVLDTTAPNVELIPENLIFSPDGDSKKDKFILQTKNCSVENLWKIEISNSAKNVVKTFRFNKTIGDEENKNQFVWDATDEAGNKVSDGKYFAEISSIDEAGNKFYKKIDGITVDTRQTKAYVTATYEGVSPLSETGLVEQKFKIHATVTDSIKEWRIDVVGEDGKSVYSVLDKKSVLSTGQIKYAELPKEISWNPQSVLKENSTEKFFAKFFVEYEKGNILEEKSAEFLATNILPKLDVQIHPEFFSPDDDGTDDDLFVKLKAATSGKLVKWSFTIFNPEESGKSGKAFWKTSGANKITEQLVWNGLSNMSKEKNGQAERVQSAMDYPWEFAVTDSIGLTQKISGKIFIDILVTRDGTALKMAVPAIIFRSNHADFKTASEAPGSKVTVEQARNNEKVLKRVADVLKKFPDYTVTVVGHANNITGTEAEETSTEKGNIPLIPLSQDRADFVKQKLESYGIESRRMSTEGKGGRERIASLKDKENWWKNRRVEFILHK